MVVISLLFISCNQSRSRRHGNRNQKIDTQVITFQRHSNAFEVKKGEVLFMQVVGITDGDTFIGLIANNQQLKCRIYGIDAPEKKQPFSKKSKQYLSDLIYGKPVRVLIQRKSDKYGRPIVWVYTPEEKDVSAEMLRAGMAWHYKKYSKDKAYAQLEMDAKNKKIGIWSESYLIAPWDWRDLPKEERKIK